MDRDKAMSFLREPPLPGPESYSLISGVIGDGTLTVRPRSWARLPSRLDRDNKPSHVLPKKEVIQPHLPVQLPCYDFVPVTDPTLGACLPDESGLAQRLQVLPTSMT